MWSNGFTLLVTYVFLGAGLFSRRSPFFHHRGAPAAAWADGPMKLVDTPWTQTKRDDLLTTAATHMALLHNAIIRGYNSIYIQAPHIKTEDVDDFIAYALTWHKFVVSHHDDEEEVLFPDMTGILMDKDIWGDMKEEHESFLDGLASFQKHLQARNSTTGLLPTDLLAIMDSFSPRLEHHLHHEVAVMAGMSSHPNVPVRKSPRGGLAADLLKAWGKNTVSKAGYRDVLPFFLLNADRTFEHGTWAAWPRIPAPVRWGLVNVVGMWHGSRWRFSSCDAAGMPRELFALQSVDGDKSDADKSEL